MNAHAVHTSPTLRGKYILERVLCSMVPPPPDSVDLDLSDERRRDVYSRVCVLLTRLVVVAAVVVVVDHC